MLLKFPSPLFIGLVVVFTTVVDAAYRSTASGPAGYDDDYCYCLYTGCAMDFAGTVAGTEYETEQECIQDQCPGGVCPTRPNVDPDKNQGICGDKGTHHEMTPLVYKQEKYFEQGRVECYCAYDYENCFNERYERFNGDVYLTLESCKGWVRREGLDPEAENIICPIDSDLVPPNDTPDDPNDGGMSMDPHVQKFNKEWFDFHGECDLVLLTDPAFGNGAGLDVHVRTTIRYDYSYISAAAIRIGSDVLEVGSWGLGIFNGVALASRDTPETMNGMPLLYTEKDEKHHSFVIQVDKDQNITLDNFKDFVNVRFHVSLPESAGLLGDYHTGASLARDGQTVLNDPKEFGQEWQVLEAEPKLFQTIREPQAPNQKCRFPKPQATEKRRLGASLAREKAEAACAKWTARKEACVHDVLATGDLEVADYFGYA